MTEQMAVSREEIIYTELFRAISLLEIPPGTQLAENRVAAKFGVSRTPVRQALHHLEHEGLVEQAQRGTYVVRGLTLRDVNEICDLLEMLDHYVVRSAAERCSPQQAQELFETTQRMKEAAEQGDIVAWGAADKTFHDLIQDAAGNDLVATLLRQTRARIHMFWANSVRPERLVECSTEHEEIARSICKGNPDQAVALVSEHIRHMRASLTDILKRAAAFLPRSVG